VADFLGMGNQRLAPTYLSTKEWHWEKDRWDEK